MNATDTIKPGDIVRWYCPMTDTDRAERFTVLEVNSDRGIMQAVCDLPIKPTRAFQTPEHAKPWFAVVQKCA